MFTIITMAEKNKIYKCNICGNIVSVINAGEGELVCCGQPMEMLIPKGLEQEGKEKHVPIVSTEGDKVKIQVGSEPHPMTEEHHIQLIQVLRDGCVVEGKRLYPRDKPEVEFTLADNLNIKVRALCNIHGLWMN